MVTRYPSPRILPFGRFWGATLTFIVLAIEALLCIFQGIQGQWIWCCAR
jgi:hypothetical protein